MAALVLLVQEPIHAALGDRLGLFACVTLGMLAYGTLALAFLRPTVRAALGFFARRGG